MSYVGFSMTMASYCSMFKVPTILEIGIDRGQTALPLIHNLISLGRPFKWIGIDVRQDSLVYNQLFVMNGVSMFNEAGIDGELVNKTLTRDDQSWNVALITANSLNVLPSMIIDKWKFDLILIDGDHNYATVSKELGYIEDLTHDASLVIMDDYDSSWGNKDLYYKDRQTHESNELLFKPEAIPGKAGVKAAVDDWLQENASWHGFQLAELVILAPKGISLRVESGGFGYRDSIINFFWEEGGTITRFTDDVIQALSSNEEDGWSYLKLIPPKRGLQSQICWELRDTLTEVECSVIIDWARPRLTKSKVINEDSYDGRKYDERRTNSQVSIYKRENNIDNNPLLKEVFEKIKSIISTVVNLPIENQEPLTILNYQIGELYEAHHDYFYEDNEYWNSVIKTGGQRLYSALIYLNDVEVGGETDYPYLDFRVKPEFGKMIIHKNHESGINIEHTLHGALPPISGEKWALVCWIRENKWIKS